MAESSYPLSPGVAAIAEQIGYSPAEASQIISEAYARGAALQASGAKLYGPYETTPITTTTPTPTPAAGTEIAGDDLQKAASLMAVLPMAAVLAPTGPAGWVIGTLLSLAAGLGISQIPGVQEFLSSMTVYCQDVSTARVTAAQHQVTMEQQAQGMQVIQQIIQENRLQAEKEAASLQGEREFYAILQEIQRGSNTEMEVAYRATALAELMEVKHAKAFNAIQQQIALKQQEMARTDTEKAAAETAAKAAVADVAALEGADTPGLDTGQMAGALSVAGLAALAPTLAKSFARESHAGRIKCFSTTGQELIRGMLPALLPIAGLTASSVFPGVQEAMTGAAETAFSALNKPLLDQAPITPDKAFGVGPQLLQQALIFGVGAHMLSVTAEAYSPAKHMGLGYLSAFLTDMAGFSRIAMAFQGTMIQWALAQPMRYWALNKFRPMMPDLRQAIELALKREISPEQFNELAAYQGYSDDWIEVFHRWKWRDPRLFEVLWIADVTRPPTTPPSEAVEWLTRAGMEEWIGPDWWYAIKFAKAGYDPIDLPVLTKVTKRRTIATARTRRLFSTRQLYREGYIGEEFIREQFGGMDEPEESAEHWIQAEKLERQFNLLQERKKTYIDEYMKDVISLEDLRLVLATMIVDPEFLAEELRQAELRKYKPVAEKEDPQVAALKRQVQAKYVQGYTQLFRKDRIDADTFEQYLVGAGVASELASATRMYEEAYQLPKAPPSVEEEEEKLAEQVQKQSYKYYTELYKKEEISAGEFYGNLVLAGMDRELAEVTVATEVAKKLSKP